MSARRCWEPDAFAAADMASNSASVRVRFGFGVFDLVLCIGVRGGVFDTEPCLSACRADLRGG
jgi:hypothetical protein